VNDRLLGRQRDTDRANTFGPAIERSHNVSKPQQSSLRSRLLKALPAEDFDALAPHLQRIELEPKCVLIAPRTPITDLYFPEAGFASIVAENGTSRVEVGIVGREGLVGASAILLGLDESPHEHFVQMPGAAYRISTETLRAAVAERPALRRVLLRSVHVELVQVRQTAYVNATFITEVRLARWLLMCHDRGEGDDLALTHEFLSIMLGVQRGGVTLALQSLEGAGRIRARRGRVTILRRDQLEALADGAYGMPEAEYVRLVEGG
jgi:CRP-like cAMP-binding protein